MGEEETGKMRLVEVTEIRHTPHKAYVVECVPLTV